jgi:aryl-alcohol dehydrogenase-like predicted oxidoreductase
MTGVDLAGLSRVGFGCYRVHDETHAEALTAALDSGCNLVDTAASYGDGLSEEVIGRVLHGRRDRDVFVVTKVGYITPSAATTLSAVGCDLSDLRQLDATTMYGLDPEVLTVLMDQSRRRLGRSTLDAVLLHNPEHALDPGQLDVEKAKRDVARALSFLADEVASGRLRYFGVSSNALVAPPAAEPAEWLSESVFAAAADDDFALLQFPLNLLERGAIDPGVNEPSMIERMGTLGIRTISNRPLNAIGPTGRVRLAFYPGFDSEARAEAGRCFDDCVALVSERLLELGEERSWADFTPMQFLRDNRNGVEDPDVVDAIWANRIYPFLEVLEGDAPWPQARERFGRLYEHMRAAAQAGLAPRTHEALSSMGRDDLVDRRARDSLAAAACRYCLESGVDHVLVGMRTLPYVNAIAPLLMEDVSIRRAEREATSSG